MQKIVNSNSKCIEFSPNSRTKLRVGYIFIKDWKTFKNYGKFNNAVLRIYKGTSLFWGFKYFYFGICNLAIECRIFNKES